ncbi:MAG: hypothetical protein HQ494_01930 [Rhodospirillales bacterium]|nr:hypothetical protein [Rhodospirillales bacterium]
MGMAAGLSIAYMKILSLAAVIMALSWAAAKVWLVFYQKKLAHADDSVDGGGTD